MSGRNIHCKLYNSPARIMDVPGKMSLILSQLVQCNIAVTSNLLPIYKYLEQQFLAHYIVRCIVSVKGFKICTCDRCRVHVYKIRSICQYSSFGFQKPDIFLLQHFSPMNGIKTAPVETPVHANHNNSVLRSKCCNELGIFR